MTVAPEQIQAMVAAEVARAARVLVNSPSPAYDASRVEQAGHEGVNARVAHRRFCDYGDGYGSGALPSPFEMTLAAGTATFAHCYYQRQMCVRECSNVSSGVLTATVGMTGTVFVGVDIVDETGAGTIVTGNLLSSVSRASLPDDQTFTRIPLYQLLDGNVVCDLRHLVQTGFYT